jgi:hypothetical protein
VGKIARAVPTRQHKSGRFCLSLPAASRVLGDLPEIFCILLFSFLGLSVLFSIVPLHVYITKAGCHAKAPLCAQRRHCLPSCFAPPTVNRGASDAHYDVIEWFMAILKPLHLAGIGA